MTPAVSDIRRLLAIEGRRAGSQPPNWARALGRAPIPAFPLGGKGETVSLPGAGHDLLDLVVLEPVGRLGEEDVAGAEVVDLAVSGG